MRWRLFLLFAATSVLTANDQPNRLDRNWPQHLHVAYIYLPAVRADADRDHDEIEAGAPFDHDLGTGRGHGLQLSLSGGSGAQTLGLFYFQSGHVDKESREDVIGHSLALEAVFAPSAEQARRESGFDVRAYIAMGGGVAGFRYPSGVDDKFGAAWQLRGALTFHFAQRCQLGLGVGYFIWGYPGETIGNGFYATLEFAVRI